MSQKLQKFIVVASRAYEVEEDDFKQATEILMQDVVKDFPTECVDLKVIPYEDFGLENGKTPTIN